MCPFDPLTQENEGTSGFPGGAEGQPCHAASLRHVPSAVLKSGKAPALTVAIARLALSDGSLCLVWVENILQTGREIYFQSYRGLGFFCVWFVFFFLLSFFFFFSVPGPCSCDK